MTRVLSFAVALAALVGIFLLPSARPTALAALHGQVLLDEEVPDPTAPAPAEGAARPTVKLWELILRSPNYSEPEEGKARLTLGYARLHAEDLDALSPDHVKFEDAILRGLRQKVASERGRELEIRATDKADEEGLSLTLTLESDSTLKLTYRPTPAQVWVFPFDWRPSTPLSLLPPLVAIALAVLLRRPVISLFTGVLAGALLLRWARRRPS